VSFACGFALTVLLAAAASIYSKCMLLAARLHRLCVGRFTLALSRTGLGEFDKLLFDLSAIRPEQRRRAGSRS
jgi:hypothetical protein